MPIDPQGFKPSMSLPSATRSVACSLGYMDPQENLRCLSRVPQGPFGVHARMVREAFYAGPSSVKPWHHLRKHELLKMLTFFKKTLSIFVGGCVEGICFLR